MENLRRESSQSSNTNYQPERQSSGRTTPEKAITDLPGVNQVNRRDIQEEKLGSTSVV